MSLNYVNRALFCRIMGTITTLSILRLSFTFSSPYDCPGDSLLLLQR